MSNITIYIWLSIIILIELCVFIGITAEQVTGFPFVFLKDIINLDRYEELLSFLKHGLVLVCNVLRHFTWYKLTCIETHVVNTRKSPLRKGDGASSSNMLSCIQVLRIWPFLFF